MTIQVTSDDLDNFKYVTCKIGDSDLVFYTGTAAFTFKGTESLWVRETLEITIRHRWKRIDMCAPIAALASIFNEQTAVNAGWAVDNCVYAGINSDTQFPMFNVALAVSDIDGYVFRAAFQATVLGKIH